MSVEEEAAILAPFKVKAEQGKLAEIREIKAAYRNAAGHLIRTSQIYYVLHRHGRRKVMPRSRHPQKADNMYGKGGWFFSGFDRIHDDRVDWRMQRLNALKQEYPGIKAMAFSICRFVNSRKPMRR